MKRFDTFGEYMYDLLFGPLKKGRQVLNQFFIFFKVIGRIFDHMKEDVFRIRDEANVASASPIMLPVHGQDRDMPRLLNETAESYRTRLSMKALIAAQAGTMEGLKLCLISLEVNGEIIPYYMLDRKRWAEFLVKIYCALDDTLFINVDTLKSQIRKIKPGSAKDNYLFAYFAGYEVWSGYGNRIRFLLECYPYYRLIPQKLLPARIKLSMTVSEAIRNEASVTVLNILDGTWYLDNSRKLNGGTTLL